MSINITHEGVRRGLRPIERKLNVQFSDDLIAWLFGFYSGTEERPWWLSEPGEWQDLQGFLQQQGMRWIRPKAPGGIILGRDRGLHVALADASRTVSRTIHWISCDQLIPVDSLSQDDARPADRAPIWVQNTKFGLGEVLESLEGGKIKVRFESGIRTLLADRTTPALPPTGDKVGCRTEVDAPSGSSTPPEVLDHPLVRRYRNGECLKVYQELASSNAVTTVAVVIAREMMQRVRRNVLVLAERWRRLGSFELTHPCGPTEASHRALAELERHLVLPVTLRAFYEELGFIDLIEPPPTDSLWPSFEKLDALSIFGPEEDPEADDGEHQLLLFEDAINKAGYAGTGGCYARIARDEPRFDPEIWFEGESIASFVPYLRTTILEGGGIGSEGFEHVDRLFLRPLVEGLEPF